MGTCPDEEAVINSSIESAPEQVQEHLKARGLLGTWGLYSPKLKAVPHPKSLKRLPLNALLPDVLRYPLAASILVSRLVSVKKYM